MRAPVIPILFLSLTGLTCLAGCSDFPDLDERIEPAARTAPYPALIPLDAVLGGGTEARITDTTGTDLEARASALRARAARLRAQVEAEAES